MSGLGIVFFNHPSLIFLSETRCTVDKMVNVHIQVCFKNAFAIPYKIVTNSNWKNGQAGGLHLLCTDDVEVSLQTSKYRIDVLVGNVNDPKWWRFTGFYSHPKVQPWNLLESLGTVNNWPWHLGEFNDMLLAEEKEGCNTPNFKFHIFNLKK